MKRTLTLVAALTATSLTAAALTWPDGQLLPSFPATNQTVDLFYLNGSNTPYSETRTWQAEDMPSNTGRATEGGRLCQTGIDNAGTHMVYGPYVSDLPSGEYTAVFRMKVDNNTADDNKIVTIDVRDNNNGETLATQDITRKQFSVAGDYVEFSLDFTHGHEGHALETRVYWYGASYTMVDCIQITSRNSRAENYLFSSLKGIVNKTRPRLFSYEGDAFAEGPYAWVNSLNLQYIEHAADRWELIDKYLDEISGLVVYDPGQLHTANLACVIANQQNALVCAPTLLFRLTAAPYNLPVLTDLRGVYNSKMEVYNALYNNWWPNLDHRAAIGISPDNHQASVREYAVATGLATLWLDPDNSEEDALLRKFLSDMGAGTCWLGWWPEEAAGVGRASEYGVATVASDYACNLTVHSGMPRVINIKEPPAKPELRNKLYIAFILSDGDNLQYVEHLMRKLWANTDRGKVPMGWTVSPAMVDAMPGALNYYHETSTDNDCLISGPSGYGYAYPNYYTDSDALATYVKRTEAYNQKAGLRVITVWNTITGGINQNVGEAFAANSSTLLGLTAQNTGGGLTIYNSSLPGMALSCNYCTGEEAMQNHIASAASGWDGNSPRFIIIQAQPWTDVKPTNFMNVANSLGSDYEVVRPDHLFQLLREYNGLNTDPGSDLTRPSTGIATVYVDCDYQGYSLGLGAGTYDTEYLNTHKIKDNNLSSAQISEGYRLVLYQDDNLGGDSLVITSSTSCVPSGWNDQTSSIRVGLNGDSGLDGVYYIQNKMTSLYMDVKGGVSATDQGTAVIQAPLYETRNQQWTLSATGSGSYLVTARHSGYGLDIDGFSYAAGALVQQWPYWGTPNQRFLFVRQADGCYHIIPEHTGMLAQISTSTIDEQIRQWWPTDNEGALWRLIPVDLTDAEEPSAGKDSFDAWPNPFNDILHVNVPSAGPYEIFTLTGERVAGGTLAAGDNSIALPYAAAGVYILSANGGAYKVIKR